MITPQRLRADLAEVLPALRVKIDPARTLAENGIDSIDLVDLLCIVQSRYGCDLAQVRIDDQTTVAQLLNLLTDTINERPSPKDIKAVLSVQ